MGFGIEQEDGSVITFMALAHHITPSKSGSWNKQLWTCELDDVFSADGP